MGFKRRDLVYYEGRPYIVIRPDSATSVEIFPGDTLDGIRNADRGFWVSEKGLTPRDPAAATPEELALNGIWHHFRKDDWDGALAELAAYGNKRALKGES
jgi:hypothetical protein